MDLDWIIENKTVPLEVTYSLQQIADKYQYSSDMMHQQKQKIIDELRRMRKGYLVKFLFPNGVNDDENWIHALIRMEVRRLNSLVNSKRG